MFAAMAAPMPRPPPVTKATCPARLALLVGFYLHGASGYDCGRLPGRILQDRKDACESVLALVEYILIIRLTGINFLARRCFGRALEFPGLLA